MGMCRNIKLEKGTRYNDKELHLQWQANSYEYLYFKYHYINILKVKLQDIQEEIEAYS